MYKFIGTVVFFCSMQAIANDLSLEEKMKALDYELFESFNNCQDALELSKHAEFFSPTVEFYHDQGGVTWDRESMISNTKKNACGNYTRKLIPATFAVHEVKGFGAITQGVHVFCETKTDKCEGQADFVMIWANADNQWKVTRVLSYGHREHH